MRTPVDAVEYCRVETARRTGVSLTARVTSPMHDRHLVFALEGAGRRVLLNFNVESLFQAACRKSFMDAVCVDDAVRAFTCP